MTEYGHQESLYLRAFKQNGYWTIKIALDRYDAQGTTDEVLTLRTNTKAAQTDEPLDQAWIILILAVHFLESMGAAGRVAGADWPALPI
jgi:hypothetical protein